ncbi:alkyl/aryl-sulfatase [Chitiniphilus shinanonensis]|uniref:Alkyl/aryl-sulfatase n=1 Tax=Chitiniphilus shinanonensis TaxID=553088 RepID=A0ABQ6BRF3_9NEIS|nr:alkyl sulfatase dimerization domain-containing protein [Chitiniphilus shinanonensis]GLS04568.1 alkyl/aryl-sulfatase [Chitiniphilus shinanonensis]
MIASETALSRLASSLTAALLALAGHTIAADLPVGVATDTTRAANQAVLQQLDFNDRDSFDAVNRGLIAKLPDARIKSKDGKLVYDADNFAFLRDKPAPDTVNPSFWRQSQLNAEHGLYKVADRIYQFRGYDIANMTLIQGDTGWIIIDTTTSTEVAAAGLKLANEKLGQRPVKAVIITHSHADHFGGVLGVVSPDDIKNKKVEIIAPVGFLEESVSENLYAGNAMGRRARYSYGDGLPLGASGSIGTGLGVNLSQGTISIAEPTRTITHTGEQLTVDGLDIVFQNAPGTEAPAEMLFYFPQLKALCLAEDSTYVMHNLYTLRGAKVRSPLVWANTLNTTLELFGDKAEVAFASHTWPTWGNAKIREHLSKQRDMYRFINDQTLRLANQGYDAEEIAERLTLPDALGKEFYNRGYYGSLKHNVKATYQLYLGFFNGNPATLDALPRVDAAKRYVEAMGGAAQVLQRGRKAFDAGDYRWTAELVNHVVYADPGNQEARALQAAALEQLGFQAESATWRGFYLMGANELRGAKPMATATLVDPRAVPVPMAVDYASTLIDPARAVGKHKRIGLRVTGAEPQSYTLTLENAVLFLNKPVAGEQLDSTVTLTAPEFGAIVGGMAKTADLVKKGTVKVEGEADALDQLAALFDRPDPAFPLIEPVTARK